MAQHDLASTLEELNVSLHAALEILNGPKRSELMTALHDSENLPQKALYGQATQTIDMIHLLRQLLEPRSHHLGGSFFR